MISLAWRTGIESLGAAPGLGEKRAANVERRQHALSVAILPLMDATVAAAAAAAAHLPAALLMFLRKALGNRGLPMNENALECSSDSILERWRFCGLWVLYIAFSVGHAGSAWASIDGMNLVS